MSKTSKKLYIIFQGTGQKIKKDWDAKTNPFLSALLKKGKVFLYQNRWFEKLDYPLSYLTMEGFIEDVYNKLIEEIPNVKKYKWIPIGFSFGGCFAYVFSFLYKKYCDKCVLIDNPPYFTMKANKARIRAIEKNLMGHKFRRLTEKEFLKMKKDNLIDYGVISYAKYIQKNIINRELEVPIVGYYNIYSPDIYSKEFEVYLNKQKFEELNKLGKLENFNFVLFKNIGHKIYKNKDARKIILGEI